MPPVRKKYQQLPNFRRWVDVELRIKDLDSNSSNVREAAIRMNVQDRTGIVRFGERSTLIACQNYLEYLLILREELFKFKWTFAWVDLLLVLANQMC